MSSITFDDPSQLASQLGPDGQLVNAPPPPAAAPGAPAPGSPGFPNYTKGQGVNPGFDPNSPAGALAYTTPSGIDDSAFLRAALGYDGSSGSGATAPGILSKRVLTDYSTVTAGPGGGQLRGLTGNDLFGDPTASTTDDEDKIHGFNANGGQKQQITLGEALAMPAYEDPTLISSLQARLWAAGYYGNTSSGNQNLKDQTKPYADGVYDRTTQEAYRFLLLDASEAANNGQSIDDVLNQKAAQSKDLGGAQTVRTHGVNDVLTVDKTGAPTIDAATDKLAQTLLGAKLSDTDRQAIVDQVQHIEAFNQLPDAIAKMTARNANTAIDNQGASAAAGGGDIIGTAKSLLGTPYQWGGKDPTTGLDCAGFTKAVFSKLGLDIGDGTGGQATNTNLTTVGTSANDLKKARAGDLVFFGDPNGGSAHVGIYVGNGMMIDSPHTGASVRIDSVNGWDVPITMIRRANGTDANGNLGANAGGQGAPMTTERAMNAIAQQESGGDYNATNPSGAFGKYQFMPQSYAEWATQAGVDPNDHSPAAQDKVAQFKIGQLLTENGGDIRKVAAAWYSGDPNKADDTTPQQGGPSIADYANEVAARAGATSTGSSGPGIAASDGSTDKYVGNTSLAVKTTDDTNALVEQQLKADHPDQYNATQLDGQFQSFLKILQGTGSTPGG